MHRILHCRVTALLAFAFLCVAGAAYGADVQVAVAANFAEPMRHVAAAFEKSTRHRALISTGATGRFYAQIKSGAPFEVLLAADQGVPERLEREGLAVSGTRFTYAIGRLVLWSARDAVVDAKGLVLKRGGFAHIAIANPKLAPYGAAAVAALKSLGLYDDLAAKFVQGENIAQAHQFVSTGNALLGFVALSQVLGDDGELKSGSMWIVPESAYPPVRQDAVLLNAGRDSAAARALLAFLKDAAAQRIIRNWGYTAGLPAP
jgi:molybdate transport system substrate-binding protein